jgi:hypothetical protein
MIHHQANLEPPNIFELLLTVLFYSEKNYLLYLLGWLKINKLDALTEHNGMDMLKVKFQVFVTIFLFYPFYLFSVDLPLVSGNRSASSEALKHSWRWSNNYKISSNFLVNNWIIIVSFNSEKPRTIRHVFLWFMSVAPETYSLHESCSLHPVQTVSDPWRPCPVAAPPFIFLLLL